MRRIASLVGLLGMLAIPAAGRAQDSGIPVGSKAPGAAVETLEGQPADLADFIGKGPVLIQFWATWCSNCRALEPKLHALMEKYAGKVTVVAVAVSVNQTVERIKAHRDRYRMTQEIVYDRRGNAADAYDVPATSYVVVVNSAGTVVYTGVGSDQDLEAALRKAM